MSFNFWNQFQENSQKQRQYFVDAAPELTDLNLKLLQTASFTEALLTAALIFLTPVLIPNWKVTIFHLLLVPVMLLFFLITLYDRKRPGRSCLKSRVLCLAFGSVLLLFLMILDGVLYPETTGSLMQLAVIVLPVVFVIPLKIVDTMSAVFEVLYLCVLFQYKTPQAAHNGMFAALVSFLVSLIVSYLVMELRVESFCVRSEYRHRSMTDVLTGILNKCSCEDRVRNYLRLRPENQDCALLVFDLDNFKSVNDEFGHQAGDNVLRRMGALLMRTFRGSDIVGRIGGDEFMVLMRGVSDEEVLNKKCALIQDGMCRLSGAMQFEVTCSIGASALSGVGTTYDTLFRSADDALYEAKSFGKGSYILHTVHSGMAANRALMLIADDDPGSRTALKTLFEEKYHVLEAEDGEQALNLVSQYQDHLQIILLDIRMPKKDGYQVLQYLKSRRGLSHIPVIVVSADEQSEKAALHMGADDMIPKPIDPDIARIRTTNVLKRAQV